ncbi:MAG TPA: ABC transporter permease [Vicinamibacterales bacterium]|nr:ABC transporter permease [Vicinamibacterales bacterium]
MSNLPRPWRWLLRAVLPTARADAILADLEDDYAREPRGARAALWLTREVASLFLSYMLASVQELRRSAPMWIRDLQMACRGLRHGPLAALGASAMLSVGLLAVVITAGIASVLVFRPVSVTHGDALRRVATVDQRGRLGTRLSNPELDVIREHVGDAGQTASVFLLPAVIRAANTDVQTMVEIVDGQYFSLIGTRPIVGRGLAAADGRPGAPPVAVISEPFWRRRLGASRDVLGTIVEVNRTPYTIVGVAESPGSGGFIGASVDGWLPAGTADAVMERGWRTDPDKRLFSAFILPANRAELDSRLQGASVALARLFPEQWRERRIQMADATAMIGSQRSAVAMLLAILAGLSLLILATAASNVGGLLLAKAAASRRQAAIHLSLGSGRAVMIRRQLMEGAILGVAGGVMAIATYVAARPLFEEISLLPTLALRLQLPLNRQLVATVLGAGAGVGLLLAIGPAIWGTRSDLADMLRDSEHRTGHARGLTRLRRVLVAVQVCFSLALLIGAGLFDRSMSALSNVDLGFARDGLVAMDFDVEPSNTTATDVNGLAGLALSRAQALPGVTAAAMSSRAPIDSSTPTVEVRAGDSSTPIGEVTFYLATSRYFETVGIDLIAGRVFTEAETAAKADVAIVNASLAALLWPGEDVVGRALRMADGTSLRVVGVTANSKYRSLDELDRPHLYRPSPPAIGMTLLARTTGDPREMLRVLQAELDTVGPGLVGFFPRTLRDHLAIQLLPTRATAAAARALGALALLLSAVGLYGLISWFVELRQREIGVRMALGATARDVRRLVVRQAFAAAIPGIGAGVMLAIALGYVARSALFGVSPFEPASIVAATVVVLVTVFAASYPPSRRATSVSPATAFRQ